MPAIGNVGMPQNVQQNQNVGNANAVRNNAPTALQNAKPVATGSLRVFLNIISFGIYGKKHPLPAPAPRNIAQVAAPAVPPRVDILNQKLADKIQSNRGIPAPMQAAMREGMEALRDGFGDLLPADGEIPRRHDIASSVQNEKHNEVTPAVLRAMTTETMRGYCVEKVVEQHVQGIMDETGLNVSLDALYGDNTIKTRLSHCQNPQDVQAVCEEFHDTIRERALFLNEIEDASATALDHAYTRLSEVSGISVGSLKDTPVLTKLTEHSTYLKADIKNQENPPRGAAMGAAFIALADRMMDNKVALFNTIEALPVTPETKANWRHAVLTMPTLTTPDTFQKAVAAAQDVNVDSLVRALNEPGGSISNEELLGLFQSVGMRFERGLETVYGQEAYVALRQEPFDIQNARGFGGAALTAINPELAAAMRANPERMAAIDELARETASEARKPRNAGKADMQLISIASELTHSIHLGLPPTMQKGNANLAENVTNAKRLPIVHADALRTTIAEIRTTFGEGALPKGNSLNELRTSPLGSRIVNTLKKTITASQVAVTPENIGAMLKDAVTSNGLGQNIAKNILKARAETAGLNASPTDIEMALTSLLSRHAGEGANDPANLQNRLNNAPTREAILTILDELPNVNELITFETNIRNAVSAGSEHAFTRMSEATGIPLEEMHDKLNILAFKNSAKVMTQNIQNAAHVPNAPIPTAEEVSAQFIARAERFVTGKIELYNAVPPLESRPGVPISAELRTRLQNEVVSNYSMNSLKLLQVGGQIAQRLHGDDVVTALTAHDGAAAKSAFMALGRSIEAHMRTLLTEEQAHELEPDDTFIINKVSRQIFLEGHQDLVALMRENEDIVKGVAQSLNDDLTPLTQQIGFAAMDTVKGPELQKEYRAVMNTLNILQDVVHIAEQ